MFEVFEFWSDFVLSEPARNSLFIKSSCENLVSGIFSNFVAPFCSEKFNAKIMRNAIILLWLSIKPEIQFFFIKLFITTRRKTVIALQNLMHFVAKILMQRY